MTRSIAPSKQKSPEYYFNRLNKKAPNATKKLIKAMKEGLNAEYAINYFKRTLPADTPPLRVTILEKAISYIDKELKQGGFALV